ncbi:MAG: histidine triad nucleotide-binding protein [Actinobacteria bacterium]|nr:histidine triad nucleotide-binding protein [Actinomycetota bacterium]
MSEHDDQQTPDERGDCLFCRIVAGEIDAAIVHEDDDVVAFKDIQPKAPTHVLVVPRRHVRDWSDAARNAPDLGPALLRGVADVAESLDLGHYRVVANTGEKAGQSVFHLHLHVLGGRPMLWPPG